MRFSGTLSPVVGKPTIQYIIEEALASGITDILIISGRTKRAIEDHFDRAPELEENLAEHGKEELLKMVKDIGNINIHFVRQKEPLVYDTLIVPQKSVQKSLS